MLNYQQVMMPMFRCPGFSEIAGYEPGQFPIPEEASPVTTASASTDSLEN